MLQFKENQAKEFENVVSQTHQSVEILNDRVLGQVVSYSDQWFADATNLLKPTAPVRDATRFTHAGAWYDGWETRRHNTEEYDWVIFKAGVHTARIIGCEVDTAFFNGNHAPAISVQALRHEDAASAPSDISEKDVRWTDVIEKVECGPSQRHFFLREALTDDHYNYFKLKMYPDGGIARFRLYGKVVAPEQAAASAKPIDLCSIANGAVAIAVSDQHFGSANNLIMPGRGHDMSDGWETSRSRTPGHVEGIAVDGTTAAPHHDDPKWTTLIDKSKAGPDKEHEYKIDKVLQITHVKLTIIPDGGVKRIRVFAT
ncbi:Allantoicase [Kluyveromyces marxianus]|nr:Allantoicase [Kluyveromyces marxianus]